MFITWPNILLMRLLISFKPPDSCNCLGHDLWGQIQLWGEHPSIYIYGLISTCNKFIPQSDVHNCVNILDNQEVMSSLPTHAPLPPPPLLPPCDQLEKTYFSMVIDSPSSVKCLALEIPRIYYLLIEKGHVNGKLITKMFSDTLLLGCFVSWWNITGCLLGKSQFLPQLHTLECPHPSNNNDSFPLSFPSSSSEGIQTAFVSMKTHLQKVVLGTVVLHLKFSA